MANLTLDMRPQAFDEIVGLEPQVKVIRAAIEQDLRKPFLLTGSFGFGKTTLALLIAKEVQGWEFTGKPQVEIINAANYRGVDGIRELVQKASSYPMVGKYGVKVLDEAHQLTKEAQQILLNEFEKKTPTVWILTTTNPEKLNEGLKDRCVAVPPLTGLTEENRKTLVERAVKFLGYEGATEEFLAAATKAKIVSPRKLLKALEGLIAGLTPQQSIAAATIEAAPEFHEIAMGVVYGQWEKVYTLPWMKDKAGEPIRFKGVGEQIKALEERLKRKPKAADDTATDDAAESAVEDDDLQGKPEVARALRAITAAMLKNATLKGGAKGLKGAEALYILAHSTSPNPFDAGLEFAATVGGLYRVHLKMQGK
jgi:Holliday junction resolvasome RuvABC ATP-dependent DNA helicase subunit